MQQWEAGILQQVKKVCASMVGLDPSHNITYFVAKGRVATNYAQACMYTKTHTSQLHIEAVDETKQTEMEIR